MCRKKKSSIQSQMEVDSDSVEGLFFSWRTNLAAIFSVTIIINNLISNIICCGFIQEYLEILMHWKLS